MGAHDHKRFFSRKGVLKIMAGGGGREKRAV